MAELMHDYFQLGNPFHQGWPTEHQATAASQMALLNQYEGLA